MHFRFLGLFLLYSCAWIINIHAQLPFAQINQLVLNFNPSNAGSQQTKRIIGGGNFSNGNNHQFVNSLISYDQFLTKSNFGFGVYHHYHHHQIGLSPTLPENSVPEALKKKFLTDEKLQTFGFCISPKLNIQSKANFNQTKLTFSPSFFVELQKSNIDYNQLRDTNSYYTRTVSVDFPTGNSAVLDSSTVSFFQNQINTKQLTFGLGLQLAASNTIIQLKVPFEILAVDETHAFVHYNNTKEDVNKKEINSTRNFYTINPFLSAGHSFQVKSKKELYVILMAGIGFKYYFNLNDNEATFSQAYFGEYVQKQGFKGINQLHSTAMIRKQKLLVGGVYTQSNNQHYYGLSLGVQSKKAKAISTFSIGENSLAEITISYKI